MFKFLGVFGWVILAAAVWTGDFDPHAFYDHLMNGRDPIEDKIKNPPDMRGRAILIPDESAPPNS